VLGDVERAHFARRILEHVLDTLAATGLAGVLVATDGDDVAALAAARGAHVLRDQGGKRLASVVDRALAEVLARGAEVALVLMADLPRIEPGDVDAMLAAVDGHDVALVKDHGGRHTNALAMAPPGAMATCFGHEDSFAAHLGAARAKHLSVVVVENERLAFDVDVPADHAELTTGPRAVGT